MRQERKIQLPDGTTYTYFLIGERRADAQGLENLAGEYAALQMRFIALQSRYEALRGAAKKRSDDR